MASPTVRHIFICPEANAPMREVPEVMALAGKGLQGDRYALGTGTYSTSPRVVKRHATLIAFDDIETAKRKGGNFNPAETRRNIVIDGITVEQINALVGMTFRLGAALVRADEICIPCERPSMLSGKPDFKEKFEQSGGLRVEILEDGRIAVGDALTI
jgi:MOSC domain-containing protein YiiM